MNVQVLLWLYGRGDAEYSSSLTRVLVIEGMFKMSSLLIFILKRWLGRKQGRDLFLSNWNRIRTFLSTASFSASNCWPLLIENHKKSTDFWSLFPITDVLIDDKHFLVLGYYPSCKGFEYLYLTTFFYSLNLPGYVLSV